MVHKWSNWSGSLGFTPDKIEFPKDEKALSALIRKAAQQGRSLRVVGAGHSSTPLVQTDDILVSLQSFKKIETYSLTQGEATIGTGLTVQEAGQALQKIGLATHNIGDVDVQTLMGAIGTGTHGTGAQLQNLSSMLIGMRMVTASGELVEYSIEKDPEFLQAARVSLGTLGIFTAIRLRLLPAFQLQRREWCTHIEETLAHLDELIAANRNFDFYWYPRSDLSKLRTWNPPSEGLRDLPYAECVEDKTGWSHEMLPKARKVKFDEMEYALPAEQGPACFQEIRPRIKERWRKEVAWRVLYRTVAPDDAYLSPAYGRQTVTISLHHNAGLPFQEYFGDIEPIFRAHGGRPHWGKKHTLQATDLQPLYPRWEAFQAIRKEMDPDCIFLNDYLRQLFGEPSLDQRSKDRTKGGI
jgi:FAD/FMN-containing dehydrogenase